MSWNTSRSNGDVGLFDRVQGLVDALAVARAVPLVVQGVEARVRRQDEAFALSISAISSGDHRIAAL